MVLRTLVAGAFVMVSASAFANNAGVAGSQQSVSLDDLKAKCADLLANPQIKPVTVKISCNESSTYWAPGQAKAAQLPNTEQVGASVQMKGFVVPNQFFPIQTNNTPIQCQTFVKMQRTVHNVDTELSCSDIASITDLGAYCVNVLTTRVGSDPSLVEEHPTNESRNLCPDSL